MQPRVKYGLMIGAVAFLLTIPAAIILGFCGPVVNVVLGAAAGALTARESESQIQREVVREAALAAAIVGGIALIAHLCGVIMSLSAFQITDLQPALGQVPQSGDMVGQLGYWGAGLGVGGCFALSDLVASVLGGAGAGWLIGPNSPADEPLTFTE